MKINKYILVYIFTAFVIVSNLNNSFFLDSVPKINNNNDLLYGKESPLYGGTLVFSFILNLPIYQKLILFLVLFLSGYSAYILILKLIDSKISGLYAGILYMINPFIYIRILIGQWYLSYAVLPLAIKSFIDFLENTNKNNIIKFVFLTSIIAFNIHILIIIFFTFFVIEIFWIWKYRQANFKSILSLAILFIFLNSYWILPLITAKDSLVNNIGDKDFEAFAPSAIFDIAAMYGFWSKDYIYTRDFIPGWQLIYFIILGLALLGFFSYYKNDKIGIFVMIFVVIGILGFLLAMGLDGPFKWIFENTVLKGFRDSQKFVSMIILAYGMLGGLGINKINDYIKKKKTNIFLIILTIVPLIYSFAFFNGFAGQIKSTNYPSDWYEINNYLNNDSQDFNVLFFPWHMYMNFSWVNNTDKKISNPSKYFFDKEVISGENVEAGQIYRQYNSPDQLYIDFLFKNRHSITNFGELISILNIKYIILAKESDYKRYKFLFNQTDIELIKETPTLYLFRNKHDVSKIYTVNEIAYIKDWDDLLQKSKNEDITEKLYIIGNGSNNESNISKINRAVVNYNKKNPVYYKFNISGDEKYLVFAQSYADDWKLHNESPVKAYGVVNGYIRDNDNKNDEIKFERFYKIYIPAYIISIITFMILLVIYISKIKDIKDIRY